MKNQAPDDFTDVLEERIMTEFDRVVNEQFKSLNQGNQKVRLVGTCSSYNNCDDVWKFIMNHCEIKAEGFDTKSDACKIIAMEVANREGEVRKENIRKNQKMGAGRGMGGPGGIHKAKRGGGFQRRGGRWSSCLPAFFNEVLISKYYN